MPRCIIFAIDVEPDEQKIGRDDPWNGTRAALDRLSSLRVRLEQASQSPVHFNWFFRFDPQIERTWGRADWVVNACPPLIPAVQRHGDFTGIHVHAWNWDDRRGMWFHDTADAGWRAHCVDTSVEAYRSVLGAAPIASRFGHRSIWHEDIALLKQRGIHYDLTVEPGAPSHPLSSDPLASSSLPDYRRAPRIPYRPSPEDYLAPASSTADHGNDFWMVPMTVTRGLHWHPLRRRPFLVRMALPMNLVLRPRQVWSQLASEMDRDATEPVVTILRSGDLAQPGFLKNFRFIMERMAGDARIRDCRFVGVDRAVEQFVNAHPATAAIAARGVEP